MEAGEGRRWRPGTKILRSGETNETIKSAVEKQRKNDFHFSAYKIRNDVYALFFPIVALGTK